MALNQSGIIWLVLAAALVLLMQGGFAALEAGLVRPKNAADMATTKLITVLVAAITFWICGNAFLFGASAGGIIGRSGFFLGGRLDNQPAALAIFGLQVAFAATAANVFVGALAERLRFEAYLCLTFAVVALLYPIFGHWAWAGVSSGHPAGWLARAGFVDFAGATVVHSLGGWAALAGLLVVGNRSGRYTASGKRVKLVGSSVPLATLGLFVVWLGGLAWMGGSSLSALDATPRILLATLLATSASGATVLIIGVVRNGVPEAETALRGVLAGLVAIAGGGHAMGALDSIAVGAVAALALLGADELLARRRIDDAVGAVSVHLAGGIWGTLAVALLGDPQRLGTGLTTGGQLVAQLEGITACAVWGFGGAFGVCKLLALAMPLRVSPDEEYVGLDASQHQAGTERMDVLGALDEAARHDAPSVRGEPFAELAHLGYAADGVITHANAVASAIFGYGESEFRKVPLTSLFAPIRDEPLDLESLLASLDAHAREMRGLRRTGEDFPMEVSLGEAGAVVAKDITARKENEAGWARATEAIHRSLARELEETKISAGYASTGEQELAGGDLALLVPAGADWFGAYYDAEARAITLYGGDLVTQTSSTSALLSSVFAGTGYLANAPDDTHGLLLGDRRYPPERQVRNLADVLNRIVSREGRGEVILDMTFVHIDLGTGNAIVVNAGRTAPTLLKSGRTIRDIGGGGNPLGYAGDSELQITPFSLGPGDVVVLCGAGMVETISPDGSILRTAELKRRILARQTPRDVLAEVATLSRVVWRGTHDLFPILVFSWKPMPTL